MRATQKTTRTYFDSGKLHTDTITNGANAVNAVMKTGTGCRVR